MEEVWEWGEVVLRVHSECSLLPTLSSLLLFLCLRCQCEVSTLNRVNLFSSISHFKSFKCDFYYFIYTCKISYINLLSLPDFVTNVGNFSLFPLNRIKLNNIKQICNSTNGFWNMYKSHKFFYLLFPGTYALKSAQGKLRIRFENWESLLQDLIELGINSSLVLVGLWLFY